MVVFIDSVEKELEKRNEQKKNDKNSDGLQDDDKNEIDLVQGGRDGDLERDKQFLKQI